MNTGADTALSGVISGSNNLTKTGAATLTLSGSNTYSGSTSVSAGTLSVAGDGNLGAGSLNLANGTTLQITGNTTIDNALALTAWPPSMLARPLRCPAPSVAQAA
ncbi:autotransporter-associated beta strand repeat-containing protein [Salinicola tamaricis]|uniref:autotransporter-associated beta strand repeat-containing protein n=1 Tax=Salinicola tamaricis TaxID=1771309 RepID=UPI0013EBF586|nr:autotransporter-associated beta strand repeat-containing protein [Salinicola tamaricis]